VDAMFWGFLFLPVRMVERSVLASEYSISEADTMF
jgi:hypothetical protein